MTSSQAKLAISLTAITIAFAIWLYSCFAFPGTGFIRTVMLFGIAWLLLARYSRIFRTVSQENPINRNFIGGIFAARLFVILAGVLYAQSRGYKIPTGRGLNRPLGAIALALPFIGVIVWRFRQMYVYLGRSDD